MAEKTLESNSKRKAEKDVKKVAEPTGDEVLSSLATKKKKIETTGSNKKPKTTKKPQDSNKKAKMSKKTEDSSRKLEDSKKKVKKTDKKVKFESPVKRSGKKEQVEVKKVKKSKVKKEEAVEEIVNGADYAFPMNRVTRIVKSENSDVKLSAEAAFLFNKASEKFLEVFSKEAYARASKDGKKKIEYQHLSSLIPGNARFDFLSDFVPAKVKVADALKEIPSVET
ncbi:DNA polymerase epsilon subunit C [Heracleum sosnowskyi]|uniref:DNA polymerase epsilon subunit C n=1 Tax=Heracleum sosnowskyi TaxID=360622 RepID=A0AAD8J9N1_9APIA|nr:DNA polymerase epsilon subunit C [Heracleum sosnowskyi]